MKKILKSIKKYFFKTTEKYEKCLFCEKELKGNQRKFCSRKCCNDYWRYYYNDKLDNLYYDKGGK